jgi:hypothetical protein
VIKITMISYVDEDCEDVAMTPQQIADILNRIDPDDLLAIAKAITN